MVSCKIKKLKDIADIEMGQSPNSNTYNSDNNGTPFLQGNKTFGRLYPTIDTWTTDPKKIGKKNSILMSVRAPVGEINIANQDICIGRGLCSISMKNGNTKYLYYVLKNSILQIKSKTTGTVFDSINKKELENIEIVDFDVITQNKIIKILSQIDDKIELNDNINDNLQEMIKEYYKEVFKQENDFKKIKEVVEFSQGVQVPVENQYEDWQENLVRFIRIVDLTQGGINNIRYIENKNRGLVNYDDIFMIRYGSPGILGWNYKGIIANNLFKINPKNNDVTKNYLYCYFNDDDIQNYIKQNATSSTMPAINFSLLYDRLIAIPEKEKLMKFDRFVEKIRLKMLEIIKENNILKELRDSLLPKLMNGEIDLDKIEI